MNAAACEKPAPCLFTCKILNLKPSGANLFRKHAPPVELLHARVWPQAKELAGAHIRTHITMNYSSPQKCNSFSFKVARAAYWKGGERARSAGTHCRARESECRNSGANDFPRNLARDHHFSSSYCVPLLAALLLLLLYWILSFFCSSDAFECGVQHTGAEISRACSFETKQQH